eukprot:CAMPEP_0114508966 /NCGR_PEP_ID=MMETSP0109-20121206/12930_1 /TAXON_ID=29199 /ORGANISM="Chlorarachnion reptans, Strain CCCM449" /LENGTH=252 /DNA_ID=CAMNT_0001688031 /DNA_START=28 /DNA_END=786 /DNA_ORIENTATION=-
MSKCQLNGPHTNQLKSVMKYFRGKRGTQTAEVVSTFEDVKMIKLVEEMYSKEEVESILAECEGEVKSKMNDEFERVLCQFGLLLQKMYVQAEGQDITLSVDANVLDDAKLIEEFKNMSFDSISIPTKKKGLASLTNNAIDGKLVSKVNTLEKDKSSLQERVQKLSQQLREALKKNTELQEKLESGTSADSKSQGKLEAAYAQIKELKKAIDDKLTNSKQFQSLKTMLTKKNEQLRVLRQQLAKHDDGITIKD